MQGGLRVDKLQRENFHSWKTQIQLLLSLRELDDYIDDDPPGRNSEDWKELNKGDRKEKAIIGISLSTENLENVSGAVTAKETWKSILDIFQQHTLLNSLAARRNFYTATMVEDEKILPFINRIRQLSSTLKSMSVEISDKELAMTILNGFPGHFDSHIVALDELGNENDNFSFEFVKNRLLQEEQRLENRAKTSIVKAESSALLSNRIPQRGSSYHKCGHCGKDGHPSDRCYKKFPHLVPEIYRRRQENNDSNSGLVCNVPESVEVMTEADYVCLLAHITSNKVPQKSHA